MAKSRAKAAPKGGRRTASGRRTQRSTTRRAVRKQVDDSPAGQRFRSASDIIERILTRRVSDPYMDSGPVKRAVGRRASALASMPFKIYRVVRGRAGQEEFEEITKGPIFSLFDMPSEEMLGTQLFEATEIHLENDGEAIWAYPDLVTNPDGGPKIPAEIRFLRPRWLHAKTARSTGRLVRWEYRPPGTRRPEFFEKEETTHFKQYNPYDEVRGLATLQGGKRDIDQEHWGKLWMESLLQNSSQLGNIYSPTDGRVPEAIAKRIVEVLKERTAGPGKAYSDIFLEQGIKVDRTAASPEEMLFGDLLKFAREEAAGNYGVPPLEMGILEFANYANARVQERLFWHGTIIPRKNYVEKVINGSFFRRFAPGFIGQFDVSEVPALKDDTGERIGWGKVLHEMGFTGNEINELLDLGFESKPWRDEWFVPFSLVPASSLVGATPADILGGRGGSEGEGKAQQKQEDPAPFPRSLLRTEEARARYWKGFIRGVAPIERRTAAAVRGFFSRQQRETLQRLNASEKAVQRGRVSKQTDEERLSAILFDDEEEGRRIELLMRGHVAEAMKMGGGQLVAEVGEGAFDIGSPRASAFLKQKLIQVRRVNTTTKERLRDTLGQGFEAGENLSDLATRVRKVFDDGPARARTIARTEIGSSANGGRFVAMEDIGLGRHEWLSARDFEVRDDHAPDTGDDGTIVNVGAVFPVTRLRYPQEAGGAPGQIINCRCIAIAAI